MPMKGASVRIGYGGCAGSASSPTRSRVVYDVSAWGSHGWCGEDAAKHGLGLCLLRLVAVSVVLFPVYCFPLIEDPSRRCQEPRLKKSSLRFLSRFLMFLKFPSGSSRFVGPGFGSEPVPWTAFLISKAALGLGPRHMSLKEL